MIVVRVSRSALAGVLGCVVFGLVCVVGVTPASASNGWWHLTAQSRPGIMKAGAGRDEVQGLTVSANGGEFLLLKVGVPAAAVKWDATDAELRGALEGIYGVGDVEVSGGPGDLAGSSPYRVTFVNGLAERQVAAIEVDRESVGGVELLCEGSPCPGNVSVDEVEESRPDGQFVVVAANLGYGSVDGGGVPVSVDAQLPAGLEAVGIEGIAGEGIGGELFGPVQCSLVSLSCTFAGVLPGDEQIEVLVSVVVKPGAHSGVAQASVAGGETHGATVAHEVVLGDEATPFGIESYEVTAEEDGGGVDTQAGSHPFQLTTTITLNQVLESSKELEHGHVLSLPAALAKDLHFDLPPGLIGNPTPFPQCTLNQFLAEGSGARNGERALCAPQTVVGVARVTINEPDIIGEETRVVPMFNLEPSVGEPARFGFIPAGGVPVYLDTAVRTGGDYGVTVDVNNIIQVAGFIRSEVTFWGVPGDPRHEAQRGEACLLEAKTEEAHGPCMPLEAHKPPPLIEMPTSCTGPLETSVEADSWVNEGSFVSSPATVPLPALDGCNRLPFEPSISLTPDGQAGSTPTGLAVTVHVPQAVSLNGEGLSEADVKNTTVALPEGVAINPAGADGLQACSEEGIALHSPEPPTCPEASKIGTVKIKTPLLPNPLEGAAYLAEQNANPFGSLVAMYVYVEDPISGSRVKVAGEVVPNAVTGQLVSTFKNTPQLPFETFELHFFGGDRAPLATPSKCGAYTTTAVVEPWTETGEVHSSSTFDVTSGPNGSACNDPLPFNPSLTVGTSSIQAGGFTPFEMTMSREDGEQPLQGIALHMPKGVSGTLSTVKLCGEQQADEGTCGPESLIGETIVSVGVGGDPFTVRGGKVYITGPYKGAPFGLSIVNPAKAGPYNLGQVVVRAKLEVNEETAAITVATDDEGPYKIPTIIDGIPLQIKHVNVNINRPGFTFNATNCNPLQITGDLVSTEGATSTLQVPYQVTNCAVLAFKPKLEASTSGKTSRSNGASLHVKLGYPAGPYDANIAKVKVELPKALPSRLTTLQKACTAQVFEANPAACPAASIVGHATATTPELPVPLEGPAYFVSHGGESFPSLIIVLQGYGVTVHLVGSTFINERTGVTSSTFKTVPDAPVGSFELTLPTGPYSALGANKDLCKVKSLAMPTEFVGQNGALIKTTTKIAVTGCPKARHKAKKATKRHKGKHAATGKGKKK
jgi:hypothetical protein